MSCRLECLEEEESLDSREEYPRFGECRWGLLLSGGEKLELLSSNSADVCVESIDRTQFDLAPDYWQF